LKIKFDTLLFAELYEVYTFISTLTQPRSRSLQKE